MVMLRFLAFFSLIVFVSSTPATAQVIELPEIVGRAEGRIKVAIDSSDRIVRETARRAFGLHGAYAVTDADRAAFLVAIERASGSSVRLTVGSGRPYVEQLRQTVPGRDVREATLRACDLTVEATGHAMGLRGFFAGQLAFVGKQRGITEIYVSDLLFTRVRRLTTDRSLLTGPNWSPDGTKLLYTTYHKSGAPDIYLLDLSGDRKRPIATFNGTNNGGTFGPKGRRIAMTLSGTGNAELFTSNLQGGDLRRLTTNESLEASPSWSPDGRRLVYTSDAPGRPQLYVISANGGVGQRLPTNISGYCAEPAWNPVDGSLIAFTVAVGGGFQIAIYDFDEGGSEILTSVSDSAVEPAWLNDGRHLVFTRRQSGRTRLMLLDTVTKEVSALHNPNFGDASSASFVYRGR